MIYIGVQEADSQTPETDARDLYSRRTIRSVPIWKLGPLAILKELESGTPFPLWAYGHVELAIVCLE